MISGESEEGFPAKLPPSSSLFGIANIVRMEFELQQVICDTLDSYVLINPLSVVCIFLVLVICASIPEGIAPSLSLKLTHFEFTGRFFT